MGVQDMYIVHGRYFRASLLLNYAPLLTTRTTLLLRLASHVADTYKHLDKKEQKNKLTEINKRILHHFKGHKLGCFQKEKKSRIKNREFLYNFQEGKRLEE